MTRADHGTTGRPLLLATALVTLAAGFVRAQGSEPVHYELSYDPASHGRIVVQISCPEDATAAVLVMPRAIPMGYGEVPFDRYVRDVHAVDADGTDLVVTAAREGPRWQLGDGASRARRVRYAIDVDAMEREVLLASDTSKARSGYVGLLGYSVFAFVEGLEDRPALLTASGPAEWPVFSTLAPRSPPSHGTVAATARDFYALADSQVAMGPDLQVLRVDAAAAPLFVAQYAERDSDAQALGGQAAEALDALAAYFGSTPFEHYTVHVEFLEPRSPEHRYGFSMEHLDSCTMFLDASRALATDAEPAAARQHLYNLAHHIAHAWLPKRCSGPGYSPWTWELAPVLDSIWFSEGWGQYVAATALADEGGLGDEFRTELVRRRFRIPLLTAPGFLNSQSLVEVSRIASTRYSADFRTGRNVFARGGLMAFEIDQAIRDGTGGEKSLRDLVRLLCAAGLGRPLDLDRIPALCREQTGVDIEAIYRRWLGPVR